MDKSIAGSRNEKIRIAYEVAKNVSMEQLVIIPVMIEDFFYGNYYLNSLVRYDLANNFEREQNNLSVNLGGRSLSESDAIDSRDKEEKKLDGLIGMAETAFYACDYTNSITAWKSFLNLKPDICEAWNNKGNALFKSSAHEIRRWRLMAGP